MHTRNSSMKHFEPLISLIFIVLHLSGYACSQGLDAESKSVHSSVFFSPQINLRPGSVQNKNYFNIPFPRGHIALKSFNGEVVDENGNSIPLHETYLHHWAVMRYYGLKNDTGKSFVRNSGPCYNLPQYFGLGSETRKTNTWIPNPYGIQVGNPSEIPDGYEEKWMMNVHAIDTRGVEDRMGCTECKCSLYNITQNESGKPLARDYIGGFHCCYDETQCKLKQGFNGGVRNLYVRYTVRWVEWSPSIVPVKIYIFDVTDTGDHSSSFSSVNANVRCKVEYNVESCGSMGGTNGECVDVRKTEVVLPHGGDVIYGVAHQHSGGVGTALYGKDGHLLCSSIPFYGKGEEPGDESGYIIGMSTCYPKPGSLNIKDGELLTVVSNYSSVQMHTGVMGLIYILLAEPGAEAKCALFQGFTSPWLMELSDHWWMLVLAGGIMAAVVLGVMRYWRHDDEGYQRVVN